MKVFNKGYIKILLFTLWVCILPRIGLGQQTFTGTSADSIEDESWSDETYYEIEMLRLVRWIRQNVERFADSELLKEVAQLKKEAEAFAAEGDYTLAVLWIETIWDLLLSDDQPISDDEILSNSGLEEIDKRKFSWTRELVTGVDLWRQEFQFAFVSGDSTFLEGSGNPYTGLRFNFDFSRNSDDALQATTFFKYSRDYLTGEISSELRKPIGRSINWRLNNRFEVTSFYRDFNLLYYQNGSEFALDFNRLGPFSLQFGETFLIRKYQQENRIYPDYYDNRLRAFLKLPYTSASFVGMEYQNNLRWHPTFVENDYVDHQLSLIWFQEIGHHSSISLENQWRKREYFNITTVTDTTFQFDYQEFYLRGDVQFGMTATFGLNVEGSVLKRDYVLRTLSTPDYFLWDITPQFYFNFGSNWRLSSGFHYGSQSHERLERRLIAVADVARFVQFEDYYTLGPAFSIEFINSSGLIFSLQETFTIQRYPNSLTRNVSTINLYSDRNVNSVLLLLNWNVSSQWQLGILANMDDDRGQNASSGDSRNTIVGVELNYFF
ncbi:MAG: hypothetical protein D6813_11660 [Calditrichaeota bacterium]|nr:MAG: hypothetical protein D6813_11660 [Calditrichota bacterium]